MTSALLLFSLACQAHTINRHRFYLLVCTQMKYSRIDELTAADLDRIIQMAWEDRTSFDAIRAQFGLTTGQVICLMRRQLKPASFRLWRRRTAGRSTKHVAKRGFLIGRFRCPTQRDR